MKWPARRQRGGQVAVLIALVLFSLMVFVAFATNMGILVNDKIRVQNAADLSAYAGAYREAQALNKMAEINHDILTTLKDCRMKLQVDTPIWNADYSCTADPGACCCEPAVATIAEGIIDTCEGEVEGLVSKFVEAASWAETVKKAEEAAKETLNANVSGLGDTTGTHFFTNNSGSATRSGAYNTSTAGETTETIADYHQLTTYLNYRVIPSCPCPFGCCYVSGWKPSPIREVDSYFVKETRQPDIWFMTQASGTLDYNYLDIGYNAAGNDGGYFGGSSAGGDDRMVALAVAKPYDGSVGPTPIWGGDDVGSAAGNGDGGGPLPLWSDFLLPELYMQPTYRARLAGVHEWATSSASYAPTGAVALNPTYNDASRVHH